MPKIMCEWNLCKHNSNTDPESNEAGECQFSNTIELNDTDNKLECAQFAWSETK